MAVRTCRRLSSYSRSRCRAASRSRSCCACACSLISSSKATSIWHGATQWRGARTRSRAVRNCSGRGEQPLWEQPLCHAQRGRISHGSYRSAQIRGHAQIGSHHHTQEQKTRKQHTHTHMHIHMPARTSSSVAKKSRLKKPIVPSAVRQMTDTSSPRMSRTSTRSPAATPR